jgi:hypothetical protein
MRALVVVLLATHVTSAAAQSLGDVARREAERRQQVTSGKVYTNENLEAVDSATPPASPVVPSPPGSTDTPAASQAPPEKTEGKEKVILNGREQRDEQHWRTTIRDLRARVERANASVAAHEARLAEIDRGPQTPTALREREVMSAELTRAQRDARFLTEELTRFLTRAQMSKVPEEWIR